MEDVSQQLERHVRTLGWPEERVVQFTRFVMHSAVGSAEFALDVLNYAEEVHSEMDFAMSAADLARVDL